MLNVKYYIIVIITAITNKMKLNFRYVYCLFESFYFPLPDTDHLFVRRFMPPLLGAGMLVVESYRYSVALSFCLWAQSVQNERA